MTDHIASVRERAEREAWLKWPESVLGHRMLRSAYVKGQVDLASRLTPEKIADVLANMNAVGPDRFTPGGLEYAAADAILALLVDDTQS